MSFPKFALTVAGLFLLYKGCQSCSPIAETTFDIATGRSTIAKWYDEEKGYHVEYSEARRNNFMVLSRKDTTFYLFEWRDLKRISDPDYKESSLDRVIVETEHSLSTHLPPSKIVKEKNDAYNNYRSKIREWNQKQN